MSEIKNLLSYDRILEDRKNFREHSRYDEPGTFYFKILFYFNNPGEETGFTSNLLDLSTDIGGGYYKLWKPITNYLEVRGMQDGAEAADYSTNTAYNYLLLNGERERAGYLKDFVYLLSEISSETPWYFKSVEGLDGAVERPYYKDFKFEDAPKALTINCLKESVDNRITTLLELYRAACFSQRWKREIVPENLRKFDMGIFLFQTPLNGKLYENTSKRVVGYERNPSKEFTNSKYFEFHNCEIDQDSIKSCYSTIDNETGIEIEPKITITFEDCIVSNYNESLCKSIGDIIKLDIEGKDEEASENNAAARSLIEGDGKYSLTDAIFDKTVGKLETFATSTIKKAYLGNVNGLSVRNLVASAEQMASGDLIGGATSAVKGLIKTGKSISNGSVVNDLIPSLMNTGKTTASLLGKDRRELDKRAKELKQNVNTSNPRALWNKKPKEIGSLGNINGVDSATRKNNL